MHATTGTQDSRTRTRTVAGDPIPWRITDVKSSSDSCISPWQSINHTEFSADTADIWMERHLVTHFWHIRLDEGIIYDRDIIYSPDTSRHLKCDSYILNKGFESR